MAISSSRLASIKEYISQREIRALRRAVTPSEDVQTQARSTIQNWSKWAGQKIRRQTTDVATVDEVHLFPGWAAERPHSPSGSGRLTPYTFDVDLHISGFATSRRTPHFLTRSQRAFLKFARSLASMPKPQPIPQSQDTELLDSVEWLRLPPRPDEIPDDFEVENIDAYFRSSKNHSHETDDSPSTPDTIPADLARLNENLESRLNLFWASSLSSRRIHVSVFLQSPHHPHHQHPPLLTSEMLTGSDGYFSGTFRVNWNDISMHPVIARMMSNQTHVEHELLVEAHIINTETMPELHETPINSMYLPISHSIVRIISDIDDTVKAAKVIDGARAVFNQVFVKDLEDSIIPGMGEWYNTLWKRGARFHYVSNSPFELLPVINQFINISKLPLGSIRLRSYAGRSLFNGLLSAPATRKKAGVIEILDRFPESQFVLIGDSGEQDLELYASLAAERPGQIVGVFIRDVSAIGLEDPTGIKADSGLTGSPMKRSKYTAPFPSNSPLRITPKRTASDTEVCPSHSGAIYIPRPIKKGSLPPTSCSFEPSPDFKPMSFVSEDSSSSIASSSSSSSSVRPGWSVTERGKKRWDLQNRVNKARLLMPSHIVLRVFEDPKECVEAAQIVQRLTDVCQPK